MRTWSAKRLVAWIRISEFFRWRLILCGVPDQSLDSRFWFALKPFAGVREKRLGALRIVTFRSSSIEREICWFTLRSRSFEVEPKWAPDAEFQIGELRLFNLWSDALIRLPAMRQAANGQTKDCNRSKAHFSRRVDFKFTTVCALLGRDDWSG